MIAPARFVITAALYAGLSVGVALLGGCHTGDTGGRLDPYATGDDEIKRGNVSMPALLQFSDEAAEQLIYDLNDLPRIAQSDTRVVLELGDILNKTRSSTVDFEIVQRRLRSKLLNSGVATDNMLIVEDRRRMDRELERLVGPNQSDILQQNPTPAGTAIYDPNDIYVLQGDFLQSRRSGVDRFLFEFKLTHLASRQIVFNKDYLLAQERD